MKHYLFILFFIIVNLCNAHVTKRVTAKYGNVQVHSATAFYTEKSNKSLILGQYIALLAKELNFKCKIELWFYERETEFDSINCHYSNINRNFKKNKLNIYFYKHDFDIAKSLNLIDYIIQNSINESLMNEKYLHIYNNYKSEHVNNILKTKIYRPRIIKYLDYESKISFFFQENKFVFFYIVNGEEKIISSFDNVFDFKCFSERILLVINKNNEIQFIENIKNPTIKTLVIEDYELPYYPFKIYFLGGQMMLFEFFPNWYKERTLCYLIKEEMLIQDLKPELLKLLNN